MRLAFPSTNNSSRHDTVKMYEIAPLCYYKLPYSINSFCYNTSRTVSQIQKHLNGLGCWNSKVQSPKSLLWVLTGKRNYQPIYITAVYKGQFFFIQIIDYLTCLPEKPDHFEAIEKSGGKCFMTTNFEEFQKWFTEQMEGIEG